MKTKTITLQFYSDPGHGWLKTPIKLLEQLEIHDQISPYSYVKNTYAYLEEDADAYLFSKAIEKAGIQVKVTNHTGNRESAIRNFQSYTQQNIANIRKVPVIGMEIMYGGDFYTLLRPLASGSWEVSNQYGAIFRMKAGQLSCAMEVKAA